MTKAKSTDESPSSAVNDELMEVLDKEENIKVDQSNQLVKSSLLNQSNNEEKELDGFSGFGFSEGLINTLSKKGYKEPTPIQKAAIPELMLGRDLLGQAQTGTGKTAAFALPLLERIDDKERYPQVLVLTPTRELAMQVAESFKAYSEGHPNINILAIYGGSDFRSQLYSLKKGVEIIVGTPGRVMDHIRQRTLVQEALQCLVLDEADEMLRMGFIDDIEWILEQLPDERQMVFFSATMPNEIRRLSKRFLKDPAEITIKSKKKEAQLIKQRYITIQNSYKLEVLKRVLELSFGEGVIIFARTKAITIKLAESLERLELYSLSKQVSTFKAIFSKDGLSKKDLNPSSKEINIASNKTKNSELSTLNKMKEIPKIEPKIIDNLEALNNFVVQTAYQCRQKTSTFISKSSLGVFKSNS